MELREIIRSLQQLAPPDYQESYDNAGLITGHPSWTCKGILVALDAIEPVIDEAISRGCNLVVAHHPILFRGLKKITGSNYVERTIIKAIQHDIAIYAIHTNLDNVQPGVSGKMAAMLGLQKVQVLDQKRGVLKKLYTFVPMEQAPGVRDALFSAGAGHIGNYSECSFNVAGEGTFRPGEHTDPFVGETGRRHVEKEIRMEVIFPAFLEKAVVDALLRSHPYEEVAYDIISLDNAHQGVGSGVAGELPETLSETDWLARLKDVFRVSVIRHTSLSGRGIRKVALCGGAGSFLISKALDIGADAFVTADLKYHEFFDADGRILIADIGHFESEQFTIDLLHEYLVQKFTNFAVLKTSLNTNPVNYYF